MLTIGMLGCGNIARIIGENCADFATIVACHDIDGQRALDYAERFGAAACPDMEALLQGEFSVLVEAASIQAVEHYLLPAVETGRDVVVLSIGALSDSVFLQQVEQAASRTGSRVYLPSGAIFGLDNIKVARLSGLDRLLLRSTKHPRAFDAGEISRPTLIYRGDAAEAARRFPKNINVATTLGLAAGIEPEVELWADPEAATNRHEIEASGAFGTVSIRTDNLPSPDNPATSYLAALSVLALLKDLQSPIRVGT